jgi:hypothetical protein
MTQEKARSAKKRRKLSNQPQRANKSARPPLRDIPAELDSARRLFMDTRSIRSAARSTGVSEPRLRRLIHRYKLAKWNRKRRKWTITDRRVREVAAYTTDGYKQIKVRGFGPASLAMRHHAGVDAFLNSNDLASLAAFEGMSVTDTSGKKHFLETRPNVLLRRANAGSDADLKIYRLLD